MEGRALEFYNDMVREISKRMGNDGTTFLSDLQVMGVELLGDKFMGVFAADKVPHLTAKQPYLIANLDDSDEAGSHWIAFASPPQSPDKVYVYDSFGRPAHDIIPEAVEKWLVVVDTELDPEQVISENNCGQRCLAWLMVFDQLGAKAALTI